MRREYQYARLNDDEIPENPFTLFENWINHARQKLQADAEAMVLSTSNAGNRPSSRVVLLKWFDNQGFVFASDYRSRKAVELEQNQYASLLFYWPYADRQIRIEGSVTKTTQQVSDLIFKQRPKGSQISALVSQQSQPVDSQKTLHELHHQFSVKNSNQTIPRPEYWGGYILKPTFFEFWQGRPNRLHDRIAYTFYNNTWQHQRLFP